MIGRLQKIGDPFADDPALRAVHLFDAAPNKVEIGAFLIAFAVEAKLRGFVYGAATAAIGGVALYLYLRTKGKLS